MPERSLKWEEKENHQPSFGTRAKEAFHPSGTLKARLDFAVSRIEAQIQRLDQTAVRLSERNKSIFAKIVDAYSKHDLQHANVLANELTEIRKTEKTIFQARLALEQIAFRLKTVTELGDMVTSLTPVIGVLRNVKAAIGGVLPDAGRELEQIGTVLSGIIMDAGQTSGLTLNFDATNEDAKNILTEAAIVAEQRMKEKLPELPTAMLNPQGNKDQTRT